MEKNGKNKKKKNNNDYFYFLISRVLIILILFFAIFFQKEIIQMCKNTGDNSLYFSIKTPKTSELKIKPEIKTEEPKIFKSEISGNNLSRGSFTDLFSGTGWKDFEASTVYQDFKTSTISFAPAYQWEEIKNFSLQLKNKKIIIAKSNKKEIILITDQGEIFAFYNEKQLLNYQKNFIFIEKPQEVLLDYDQLTQKWIVIFISNEKVFLYSFQIQGNKIVILDNSLISIKDLATKLKINTFNANPIKLQLSCIQNQCLITDENNLLKFNIKTLKQEIIKTNEQSILSIGKMDNVWLIGGVKKDGEKYKGIIYKLSLNSQQTIVDNNFPFFSSKYSGNIYFGYDSEHREILAVYAAYEGQAMKFPISNSLLAIDFSRFFPIRVMDEGVIPDIFYQDKAWWISSLQKSSTPKFLRILSGIGTDFTPILLKNILSFQLVPGFKEHQIYGISFDETSSRIYRFIDQGFQKKDKVIWQSLKINSGKHKIIKGSLIEKEDGEENGKIQYFLTNDGGKNWTKAEPNKMIIFKTSGSDFRWKVELSQSPNVFYSPWLTRVMVDYYQVRD